MTADEGSLPALSPPLASCSLPVVSFSCSCVGVCLPAEPWTLSAFLAKALAGWQSSSPACGPARFPQHDPSSRADPWRGSALCHSLAQSPRPASASRLAGSVVGICFTSGGEGWGKAVFPQRGWLKQGCYSEVYCFYVYCINQQLVWLLWLLAPYFYGHVLYE